VHTIKSEISEINGVKNVDADVATKTATIVFEQPADETTIKKVLAEINYPVAE
jgi:copper chaperone CopZ